MRFLALKDVIGLLRSEVEQAGGQTAWAKKTGIQRAIVNRVLTDLELPTKSIILKVLLGR